MVRLYNGSVLAVVCDDAQEGPFPQAAHLAQEALQLEPCKFWEWMDQGCQVAGLERRCVKSSVIIVKY